MFMPKIQQRGEGNYFITILNEIAKAVEIEKGESWTWEMKDKNTLLLKRLKPKT